MASKATDDISGKLEIARKELLDLGLRNPLLNYRRLKSQGVEVVDELPTEIFRILVTDGKNMSFLPKDEKEDDELLGQPEEDSDIALERHTDTKLQTAVGSDELQARLLKTYYRAKTFMQDHGANILYVALGMLNWYESESSNERRQAPLILVPVKLKRANVRDRFHLFWSKEEVGGNLSLIEKASSEFSIKIPDLDDEEELDVQAYFDKVRLAIKDMARWNVDDRKIILGFFSFSKFLMFRDLDAANWPQDAKPSEHSIMKSLLKDRFDEPASLIGDEDQVDDHLSPDQVHHVMDADSSQIIAINDVVSGRNMVVQGPPGTGKSQTITNMIAEELGLGKRVLFVSEKMAALDVVKRRLDSVGLGDACLELHSHRTTKRTVLDELKRTLGLGKPRLGQVEDDYDELSRTRERLNSYSEAVNTIVGETGITPIQAYGHLHLIKKSLDGKEPPKVEINDPESLNRTGFRRKLGVVEELQNRVAAMGVPRDHPFWGSRLRVVLPRNQDEIAASIAKVKSSLSLLTESSSRLATRLKLSEPGDVKETNDIMEIARRVLQSPDLGDVLVESVDWLTEAENIGAVISAGAGLKAIHRQYDETVIPQAWDQDLLTIRQAFLEKGKSLTRFLSGDYRRAKGTLKGLCRDGLPKGLPAQLELIDAVLDSQSQVNALERHESLGNRIFVSLWKGEESDWGKLETLSSWLFELHRDIQQGELSKLVLNVLNVELTTDGLDQLLKDVEEKMESFAEAAGELENKTELDVGRWSDEWTSLGDVSFQNISARSEAWETNLNEIHQITGFNNAVEVCNHEGLSSLVDAAESWANAGIHLVDLFSQAWYEGILQSAFEERPALASFDGSIHEQQADKFRELDKLVIEHNRARVALLHWESLPKGQDAGGQLGVLQRQFQLKRRHLSIRNLMSQAGNAIQAIKPVFMMSPLSIASYIPPGALQFDVVIFDEASQVKPVDAFGAIMRADQSVVVGDDKQLPPTNFFNTIDQDDGDDDDSPTADIESILGLFLAQNAPNAMLRWHYRSLHESLIAVSNKEFYGNSLIVFPSPDSEREELGLRFNHFPNAVYDRGSSRTNREEAGEVAESVMEHARNTPDLTLGVAAFSTAQMQAVLDELEILRRKDPSLEDFFASHPHEPFFVKNLENVQGDERDVIFISIGYGRDSNGRLYLNFGPLTSQGGHRRLNVLITRARRRCEVFSSITADDIDLGRSASEGLRALKSFLSYAERGVMENPEESGRDFDSPFQDAVAFELRNLGYDVRQEIADGGRFIDIAIVDPEKPGRYLIGIECDGASYHSSRSARDRDRIREEGLRSRNWQLHHIWSTDWFKNPRRELERTVEAIEAAKSYGPNLTSNGSVTNDVKVVDREDIRADDLEAVEVRKYEVAKLDADIGNIPLNTVPRPRLAELVAEVVSVEGPVHIDEVSRRIANAVGVKRVAVLISAAIQAGATLAVKNGQIKSKGKFLWPPDMNEPEVRNRSDLSATSRKIEMISPAEVSVALRMQVERSYGIDRPEAIKMASKMFGYQKVTEDIGQGINAVVTKMIRSKELLKDDLGHLTLS